MIEADRQLVRDLLEVADTLERRAFLGVGLLRRAARRLTELAAGAPGEADCPRCGGPIVQRRLGRPRRFCSDRCRWASKRPRNASLTP